MPNNLNKSKRHLEWALAFWLGIGLMSIINVWKINHHQHAVTYSWIMFCTAIVAIIVCVILIKLKK
jgi:phosphate starvation-inducible membrane PsiE